MSAALKSAAPPGPRHFLELMDIDPLSLRRMLELGGRAKRGDITDKPLAGKHVALIFEKPSTRTRVSFAVGIAQLGGTGLNFVPGELHVGRTETVRDTAGRAP